MIELDHLLMNHYWHLVCHRRELPNPSDYLRFQTVIGDVVVFNDAGEIKVFDNRCPHRGALIFDKGFGSQATTCKYHGWTYFAGQMIIPKASLFNQCDIELAQLNFFETAWCGDFIFFSVTPLVDLYAQLDKTAELVENISFNIGASIDVNQYEYPCYWPIAIENALEPYHVPIIHAQSLGLLNLEQGTNEFYGKNSVWYSKIGNARTNKLLESLKKYFQIDYAYSGYMSLYLFPFSMISSTYGYSYAIQNFYPKDTSQSTTSFSSRLLTTHLASESAAEVIDSFFDSTRDMNKKVFEEDYAICKFIPKNAWTTEKLTFPNELEVKIDHFRESCRTAMLGL
jgi:phenylpropionate dioxygenase-like ring-hydroxylating dioxygenase large terminal subunit